MYVLERRTSYHDLVKAQASSNQRSSEGEIASGENRHDKARARIVGRSKTLISVEICVIRAWSSSLLRDFRFAGISGTTTITVMWGKPQLSRIVLKSLLWPVHAQKIRVKDLVFYGGLD